MCHANTSSAPPRLTAAPPGTVLRVARAQYERIATDRFDLAFVARALRVVSAAEFKAKYADSVLGYVWTLAKPLAWLTVLYFVFGRFFNLSGTFDHYVVYLFVGLVIWTFFVDASSLALESFVHRAAVLRKLSIPRMVIPLSAAMTTVLTLCVNAVAVAIFVAIETISPSWRWLLIPLPVLECVVFTFTISVLLATLFVRARDLRPLWDLAIQLMFFASPIIYPAGFLPEWMQKIVFLSPLVQGIQDTRWLVFPESEVQTAADVYSSPFGHALPLLVLVGSVLLTIAVYRRASPYLAERA